MTGKILACLVCFCNNMTIEPVLKLYLSRCIRFFLCCIKKIASTCLKYISIALVCLSLVIGKLNQRICWRLSELVHAFQETTSFLTATIHKNRRITGINRLVYRIILILIFNIPDGPTFAPFLSQNIA